LLDCFISAADKYFGFGISFFSFSVPSRQLGVKLFSNLQNMFLI